MVHAAGDTGWVAWTNMVDADMGTKLDLAGASAVFAQKASADVRDYGATGNGTTDDSAAIRAAFAAVASGGSVLFPAGNYLMASKVTVSSGVTVQGVPGASILSAASTNVSAPLLLDIGSATGITVTGLTFDGNLGAIANFNIVCQVYSSSHVVFDHCVWRNTRGIACAFTTNVSDSGVTNSQFSEVGTLYKTTLVTTDRRQAITFSSGTLANNAGNFAIHNYFSEVGLDCVSMSAQTGALIADNWIANNYAGGYYVSGCTYTRVIGNFATGVAAAGGNGIDTSTSSNMTITGNTITGRGAGGILVADGTNVAVTGNVSTNNNQAGTSPHTGGIVVAGATGNTNVTIAGNVSTDTQATKTQTYGVQITTGLTNSNIKIEASNILSGNATGPVGPAGVSSASPAWTPTLVNWSVGSGGTLVATYDHTAGRVRGTLIATLGTGFTASSGWFVSPPVTPSAAYAAGHQIGTLTISDAAGTGIRAGTVIWTGATGRMFLADGTSFTGTAPWTWASGYKVSINFDYIPA